MKKVMKNAGLVYTIMLIVFAAICVLMYSLYMLYKLGKVIKSNSSKDEETTEEEEVAEGTTEAGEREIQLAHTANS